MVCDYTFDEEKNEMRINCMNCIFGASIEDFEVCMARTIEKLLEVKHPCRIIFAKEREYEYNEEEAAMLLQVGEALNNIKNVHRVSSVKNLSTTECDKQVAERLAFLHKLMEEIKMDPILAYRNVLREIRHSRIIMERSDDVEYNCYMHYVERSLLPIKAEMEKTRLIQLAMSRLATIKGREFYRRIFHPTIRPNFMFTRYMAVPPANAEPIDSYAIGSADEGTEVEIYTLPGQVRKLYHIMPPEFKLNEEEYSILDKARRYLAEHKPVETELTNPEKIRENIYNIAMDMLRDMASQNISESRLRILADILTRYTAGLGMLELLLKDDKIQDISVNAPIGSSPLYIFHSDYMECETNIVPNIEDAESWATKFKLRSGRPLDEANPVLDSEMYVSGGSARIAAVTRSLSTDGLAFAFRRHRDRPWTYPLFIQNKFIDPFSAALMWFLIDGARTLLIAGTRSSGKSSFLGASMVQIMPKTRIISVEDSVSGDSRILYEENGIIKKGTIGAMIDKLMPDKDGEREILRENKNNIKVFSMDKGGKIKLSKVSAFIRHKVKKDIFEVETASGRKIKVTEDHSLFTMGDDGDYIEVKTSELRAGDYIVTPRLLPIEGREIENISIHKLGIDGYFSGLKLTDIMQKRWAEVVALAKKYGYSKSMPSAWKRSHILPSEIFRDMNIESDAVTHFKNTGHSTEIPERIELDEEMLSFLGLWLADGCYDKKSVIITVREEPLKKLVRSIGRKLNVGVKKHSDGFSLMINSSSFRKVMKHLGFEGNSHTKEIPSWIFGLSKRQKGFFLKGLFSGDGYMAKNEIGIGLASEPLIKDIQTLLLEFGIILRAGKLNARDNTRACRIGTTEGILKFKELVGFYQEYNNKKIDELAKRTSTHSTSDVIPFSKEFKIKLSETMSNFNYNDYVNRENNIGRPKLQEFDELCDIPQISAMADSDIFWDKVKNVQKVADCDYVYDISVPEHENFICENILAHNTLELPIPVMRELGYNVERLKSRSVITRVETELPADEAIRTALRLGDSALIIGEVRSREAKALYEAMRIGALANVVAGTIHGDSAYGVFDRVVNDLGVPATSFKATDIILICNMLKSADGLRSFRRVVNLTEVRKHWKKDPVEEGGFVDLLEYSAREDKLKPTETLNVGESVILDSIAERVPEWRGRWENMWDNIKLRENIFRTLVEMAEKTNKMELLEADIVLQSNNQFHLLSAEVNEEVGSLDSKIIFERWNKWLTNLAKRDVLIPKKLF